MSTTAETQGNKFWGNIFGWLLRKLFLLSLLVAALLGSGWIKGEAEKITNALKSAAESEQVAESLETEIEENLPRLDKLELKLKAEAGELKTAKGRAAKFQKVADAADKKRRKIWNEKKFWYTQLTHGKYYARRKLADEAYEKARKAAELAGKDLKGLKAEIEKSPLGRELTKLSKDIQKKEEDADTLRMQAKKARAFANDQPLRKLWNGVKTVLPTALWIVGGIILVPILIKAFLYRFVAPIASKAKPLILAPDQGVAIEVGESAVSIPVELERGDQVVVHSRFLQAAGTGQGKRARLLFSWKMPFTSIAAGLFAMVQVRNKADAPSSVTVSPKSDLFDKLIHVVIPAGESLVFYPRSIAAIVERDGVSPKITRHWRIWNIHSLLTFQFRYLVIHGPCELVVRGCRGVRTEVMTSSNSPRMQDQGSTLGFSPGLGYSTVRCETFFDYLLGRDNLFNDRFHGDAGIFLSDEVPDPRTGKGGLFGRGLEGLLDGVLKVFGI